MIKLKTAQADAMLNSPMFGQTIKKPFPVKTSYWLARAVDKIEQEMRTFLKQRQEVIDELAVKGEDGKPEVKKGMVSFGENAEKAAEKLDGLLDIDIELDIKKIVIDPDRCPDLSVEELMLLLPIIELKDPDKKE